MVSEMSSSNDSRPLVKVWVDGCFDLMHYGHANALRQVGVVLVDGLVGAGVWRLPGRRRAQRCGHCRAQGAAGDAREGALCGGASLQVGR